ncbi:MAG: CRISPR-associated helicase Cas3' [Halanaerobiales bacterium]|nr:CRISPR-associated helicase Cas3' [Halanaerobiales bacterium]
MKYYAHYDINDPSKNQELNDHLLNTKLMMEGSIVPCVHFGNIKFPEIKDKSELIAVFHDFAKYLKVFQDYLLHRKESKFKNHAHLSALILYNLLNEELQSETKINEDHCLNFICYLCVRCHHINLTTNLVMNDKSKWRYIEKQIGFLQNDLENIYSDFNKITNLEWEKFNFILELGKLKDTKTFVGIPHHLKTRGKNDKWFFLTIYLFSLLIDLDKLNSAGIQKHFVLDKPETLVENYLAKNYKIKDNQSLNDRRNQARSEIVSTIKNMTEDELKKTSIFTLTAPTGIGKTLSSLNAALILGKKLKKIYGFQPRIITAIPFINIIEQTRNDYEEVFKGYGEVLVNHQLSDIFNGEDKKNKSEEESPLEEKLLKVESWEADVVLTTFVQFFHSIFTGRNKSLKKLNKLAGSIVILDEVQALPERYLPLIGAVIYKLSKYLGVKFILMTATQPKIIEFANMLLENEEVKGVPLLINYKVYFKDLKRTKLIPLLDRQIDCSEDFIDIIDEKWNRSEPLLVVVNTIARSIDLFKKLGKDDRFNCEILNLSTNSIPKKRAKIIGEANELINDEVPFIMVSTQTIEAGVNLDFGMGFRDLASLASMIQTAGRVNRENSRNAHREVFIVKIKRDSEIYQLHHLDRTVKLLRKYGEILEENYQDLINEYYEKALEYDLPDESVDIWHEGIMKMDFEKIEEFELIKKQGNIVDIFVEYDDKATELADQYEELYKKLYERQYESIKEKYNLKAQLKGVIRKMSQYIMSIRLEKTMKNRPLKFYSRNACDADFMWVPKGELKRYYDEKTGYKFEDESILIG